MNRLLSTILLLAIASTSYAQVRGQARESGKAKDFKYPVLVKLIKGSGNVFRIGFVREGDFYGTGESKPDTSDIYANFMDLVNSDKGDFTGKCFVYFPLSERNGEMLIVDRNDVSSLDMRYEQAMELIVVNGNE